jgi:hypothetical protein
MYLFLIMIKNFNFKFVNYLLKFVYFVYDYYLNWHSQYLTFLYIPLINQAHLLQSLIINSNYCFYSSTNFLFSQVV